MIHKLFILTFVALGLSACSGGSEGAETEDELRAQANSIAASAKSRAEKTIAPLNKQTADALTANERSAIAANESESNAAE